MGDKLMILNLNNLDWDRATVLDGRYIQYLYRMLEERLKLMEYKEAYIPCTIFEPFGPFRYEEIQIIYSYTIYLAVKEFLSPYAFEENNGYRRFNFTYTDMERLTGFDFTENPLLPGQLLSFYDKFLKPLYLILQNMNVICKHTKSLKVETDYINISSISIPKKIVNDSDGNPTEVELDGPDLQQWESNFQCILDELDITSSSTGSDGKFRI
jgi:hypothetical protein